jgi:hypothetical protein
VIASIQKVLLSIDELAQMPAAMQTTDSDGPVQPVISPFFDAQSPSASGKKKRKVPLIWMLIGVLVVIIAVATPFFLKYLNDPLRTLEMFPVSKYLENYRSLAGAKFRGDLRVENDLGWKDGVGRLMVFTLQGEPRPIAVMIPPAMAQIYFVKGQTYKAELEVKEGGLIYANSCHKN